MRVPFCWLRDWLIWDHDPLDLVPLMESCGIEVLSIDKCDFALREAVVGKVTEYNKITGILRLSLGQKGCGMIAISSDMHIPELGTKVPFFFLSQLKQLSGEARVFGKECNGIMGSWDPQSSKTYPVLPAHYEEGRLLGSYHAKEWIFDLSFTQDLSFCQSVRGLAVYISSLKHIPLAQEQVISEHLIADSEEDTFSIHTDESHTLAYSWASFSVLQNHFLPWSIYLRLGLVMGECENAWSGLARHIMFDVGHPLLLFDQDQFSSTALKVTTLPGEKFSYNGCPGGLVVDSKDTILTDGQHLLALSGVIESVAAPVEVHSRSVFVEFAMYPALQVMSTIRKHNLLALPGARFLEKAIAPHALCLARQRWMELIPKLGLGSKVAYRTVQNNSLSFTREICLPLSLPKKILGISCSIEDLRTSIEKLGHEVLSAENDQIHCKVSSERADLKAPIDLVDDLLRARGIEEIPRDRVQFSLPVLGNTDSFRSLHRKIRTLVKGFGFNEIMNLDIALSNCVRNLEEHWKGKDAIVLLQNPSSSDRQYLRPTLLASFLEHIEHNVSHEERYFQVYEVGKVYSLVNAKEIISENRLGMFLMGEPSKQKFWDGSHRDPVDFFHFVGWLERIFMTLVHSKPTIQTSEVSFLQEGVRGDILLNGKFVGVVGKVESSLCPEPAWFAELSLSMLGYEEDNFPRVSPMFTHPASHRDTTLCLKKEMSFAQLQEALPTHALLASCKLISLFSDEKAHYFAMRFCYRSSNRTLSKEEVELLHRELLLQLEGKLGEMVANGID